MLTVDQEASLVELISEEYGDDLSHNDFAACCLQLFEDIAGFESLSDSEARQIIDQLRRLYEHN